MAKPSPKRKPKKPAVQQNLYDPLTHFPNRTLFLDRVGQAIERSKTHRDFEFSVLSVDMDRFKRVVNNLGYTAGDRLIVETARRVKSSIPGVDTAARLEGNEYALLLEDSRDITQIIRIIKSLNERLKAPYALDGQDVFLVPFIGVALSSTGYSQPEDALRDAHNAMLRAKTSGKNYFEIFDSAMRSQAAAKLKLETDLRYALERNEFRLHYQPIVDLQTGQLTGFEALIRWQHPERGMVPPNDFIPATEETGLILPIGQWVIREACLQMVKWQEAFPNTTHLSVSVNLSAKQFSDEKLDEKILQILSETGFEPGRMILEITESALMDNYEAALTILNRLKEKGIQLHMDDFGTGYSSLSNLHRFPIDTLKIDRSFIQRMGQNGGKREIVHTIISLAWDLGMGVTAEGIETAEQLQKLRLLKCMKGQGYFFSKPLENKALEPLLSSNPRW